MSVFDDFASVVSFTILLTIMFISGIVVGAL